jgi:hypothetical protein
MYSVTVIDPNADKHYNIKGEDGLELHSNVIRFNKTISISKLITKELIGGYFNKHIFMTTETLQDSFMRQTSSKAVHSVSRNSSFIICHSGREYTCGPARTGTSHRQSLIVSCHN